MNQTYTVKAGDTLYGISNQFGVSVTDLANINNVNANSLKVGQVLKIPSNSGSNPNSMFMYTVAKGDSLYKIAQKYDTTIQALVNLNNLKSTNLYVGQVLRIPETYTSEDDMQMPNFSNYVVKRGDSLYSIARLYNLSVDTIMKDNALTTNNLSIGQNLKIRLNKDVSGEIEECLGPDYIVPSATSYVTYTVVRGDNLYNIASKYNTSVSTLMELNNLKNTNLFIGQQLKIPSKTTGNVYVVKSGDNLYSIARKFNTTVDNLKRKNNLTSNLLSIGQKLNI